MKNLLTKVHNKLFPYRGAPVKNPTAGEFEVDNGVVSYFVLRKVIPIVGLTPFPLNELQLMTASVCRFRPTHIFEWGTHIGKSARVFYETARYFNIPTEIHSIDLPDNVEHIENPHSKRGRLVKGKKNVFLHLGDGLDTALQIYGKLPSESRVLFFVDGDHGYESVKREVAGIIGRVKNPIILAHDTFYQTDDSGYNVGPYKAIKEALGEQVGKSQFKVIETKTGLPGMTLLYK